MARARLLSAWLLALVLLAVAPARLSAQDAGGGAATLVADAVFVTEDGQLIAEGNVEAFQDGSRLRAARIVYDREDDSITIEGPILLDDGSGAVLQADAAELDTGFQNGILQGARLVFNQQLQVGSYQAQRVRGRYTQLYRTAATSCRVCENGRAPLWQIRANRVVHDQLERQIYFEGAQFRVLDLPVAYIPVLRVPDPTLDRANGFLVPTLRVNSQLGTGINVPYFFRLGDHADVTIAPFVSPETFTLGFRYRQAFRNGNIALNGAVSEDSLREGGLRGYLFGRGNFNFKNDFRLDLSVQAASDDGYLSDYGISDADRLRSQATLTRTRRDSYLGFSIIRSDSLRDTDPNDTTPSLIGDAFYQKRLFPARVGGELRLTSDLHAHTRDSTRDMVGRDVVRGTASANYMRSFTAASGLQSEVELGLALDAFDVEDDSTVDGVVLRTTPVTAVTLRYPMTRQRAEATQFLEPVLQVAWSEVIGDEVPNDESLSPEFDEGNLLSLSRFPAPDRREEGWRMAYGVNWARQAATGWRASAAFGQVLRAQADPDFTPISGLQGTSSDFLLAGQVELDNRLTVNARSLFDETLQFTRAELRGNWAIERLALTGTYVWQAEEAAETADPPPSEIWLNGNYRVSRHWVARANWRYDFNVSKASFAGVGVRYRNECVDIDLSLNRRFTSSSTVEPSTDFGFTIALRGFALADGAERYARTCS